MKDEERHNERLFSQFDAGSFCDAIVGCGDFFIPGVTRRESHDRLLVISQMGLWGRARGRECAIALALEQSIVCASRRDDLRMAFEIAWAFLLVRDEEWRGIDVDLSWVAEALHGVLTRRAQELSEDRELASLVTSVQARLRGV